MTEQELAAIEERKDVSDIPALIGEIRRLRDALKKFDTIYWNTCDPEDALNDMATIARAALQEGIPHV